jgi:hypothetical protein
VIAGRPKGIKKHPKKLHHYSSVPHIHYDPQYESRMMASMAVPKDEFPEFVNSDEYRPSKDVYFDTKQAYRGNKDERINYFLPPIDDTNKKTNLMYPTVLGDDMIMTRQGIVPRTSRRGGVMNSYNGPIGRHID